MLSRLHDTRQSRDAFGVNRVCQFAAFFERAADDEPIREGKKLMGVFAGDAAAKKNARGRTSGADSADVFRIGGMAGAYAGNNEGVGKTAVESVMSGIFERAIAQRNRVLDVNVGENLRVRRNSPAIAQSVEGIALDDSLISDHRAAEDIHTNETSAARRAKGQRGAGIVAKDIEADGDLHSVADGAADCGHRGDGFGADGRFRERCVAKIFDEDSVRAALFVSLGIGDGGLDVD